jgi:hypothetical protein
MANYLSDRMDKIGYIYGKKCGTLTLAIIIFGYLYTNFSW